MQRITTNINLKNEIKQLEYQQASEGLLLKESFLNTCKSLKPANLIKDTFKELAASPDIRNNIITWSLSYFAGYFSKTAIMGPINTPLKQLLGDLLQTSVSKTISKNAIGIKSVIRYFIKSISGRRETTV